MKKLNVLSYFDGMSCTQIALDNLGFKVGNYYAAEIEKFPMIVTNHNFPNTKQIGDVRKVNGRELGHIDLFVGGSPCQDFSFAGKQVGMSTTEKLEVTTLEHYLELKEQGFEFQGQSYLFWEFVRTLRELQETNPTVSFLLENVHMAAKWEKIITDVLGVEPIKINSRLVSAQNRPRIYWTNIDGVTQPEDRGITIQDILVSDDEVADKWHLSEKAIAYMNRERNGKKRFKAFPNPLDGKAGCVVKSCHKGTPYLTMEEKMRRFTVEEVEQLQTVPKGYTNVTYVENGKTKKVSDSQRLMMLGNGFTVAVIEHILKNLDNG